VSGTIRYGQIEIECGGQIFGDIQARPAGELRNAAAVADPSLPAHRASMPDGLATSAFPDHRSGLH
jgi:hypothetical protein